VVPGTVYTKYTALNIWAPSRAMALGSRRRSRSLLADQKRSSTLPVAQKLAVPGTGYLDAIMVVYLQDFFLKPDL